MSSYLVLQSPVGFHIFSDPDMILVSETEKNPQSLKEQVSFLYPNALTGAQIIHDIEHKYILPKEIKDFFESFINSNRNIAKAANWYFISQILSNLVSEQFGFSCFMLPPESQRNIYSNLPGMIKVPQEVIDTATAEVTQALYSDQFLIYAEDQNLEEEEDY